MLDPQLITYISQQRQAGIPDDQIRSSLLSSGWQATDIDTALGGGQAQPAQTTQPVQPTQQPQPVQQPQPTSSKKTLILIIVMTVLIIALIASYFLFFRDSSSDPTPTPQSPTKRTTINAYGTTITPGVDYYEGLIVFSLRNDKRLTYQNGTDLPEGLTPIDQLDDTNPNSLISLFNQYNSTDLERNYRGIDEQSTSYTLHIPEDTDILEIMTDLQRTSEVRFAEPRYIPYLDDAPSDPFFRSKGSLGGDYDDQWNFKLINMEQAWEISKGEGVTVAVIDSGVDHEHPDLEGNVQEGYYYSYGWKDTDIKPRGIHKGWVGDCTQTHGTMVSSILAAKNDGKGMVGVAPKAKIIPIVGIRSVSCNGIEGESLGYEMSIRKAADLNVDVINMSLGYRVPLVSADLTEAVLYAVNKGTVYVTSAGNDHRDTTFGSPENIHEAIVVAAVDENDKKTDYSNYGPTIDVTAPGGTWKRPILGAWSTMFPGDATYDKEESVVDEKGLYAGTTGTSFSAPTVAGVAALVIAQDKTLTPSEVECALKLGAKDVEEPGFDPKSGFGRVDAYKSLLLSKDDLKPFDEEGNPTEAEKCFEQVAITYPGINEGINATRLEPLGIRGLVSITDIDYYVLEYLKEGANPKTGWIEIFRDTKEVKDGILGQWDIKDLEEGNYQLRLHAFNKSGKRYENEVSFYIYKTVACFIDGITSIDGTTRNLVEPTRCKIMTELSSSSPLWLTFKDKSWQIVYPIPGDGRIVTYDDKTHYLYVDKKSCDDNNPEHEFRVNCSCIDKYPAESICVEEEYTFTDKSGVRKSNTSAYGILSHWQENDPGKVTCEAVDDLADDTDLSSPFNFEHDNEFLCEEKEDTPEPVVSDESILCTFSSEERKEGDFISHAQSRGMVSSGGSIEGISLSYEERTVFKNGKVYLASDFFGSFDSGGGVDDCKWVYADYPSDKFGLLSKEEIDIEMMHSDRRLDDELGLPPILPKDLCTRDVSSELFETPGKECSIEEYENAVVKKAEDRFPPGELDTVKSELRKVGIDFRESVIEDAPSIWEFVQKP
ncbi:MAG: S8 family serine peptidase [Parcubacteria group bacterium]